MKASRRKLWRYIRAAWLTVRIWKSPQHPGYDANEPFASIGLKLAWEVSRGIWLDRDIQPVILTPDAAPSLPEGPRPRA